MDNIILSGMLKEFISRHEIADEPVDSQFEKFANYCLLKTDHYDSFDFDKVGTGDCIGVDGIAVAIGGVIVDELDDAALLTKAQFDAKFSFAQAKTSPKFNLGDFLKFVSTVKLFFGKNADAIPAKLKNAYQIKELIYERAGKLRELPTVELSYVYSGRFDLERNQIVPLIENEIAALQAMPYLFSDIRWHVYDGDALARLYREAQNGIEKEISFQRHVALPPISSASAAYIGVVKCGDYVRLIQKENGELNKGLFFENVRDFLGDHNPVNEEIAKTIHTTDERDRFAILNNGVTVVAKSVTPSGDIFKISQFQVVNGCQTSHVLFKNRQSLSDDMYITVKLIETSDVDLSGKVIATTNSQSQVTKEAFATIRPYHRGLEDFFNAMRSSGYSYYYERRPHQYDDRDDISQHWIVSAPTLIKSFVSVVLEEPHKVHYYYGRLLLEYNRNQTSELFSETDYPGIYFAAHHIASKTRAAIGRNGQLANWTFHLALLIKKQIAPELNKANALTDKRFLEVLRRIDEQFDGAYQIAAATLRGAKVAGNQNRLPDVTKDILAGLRKNAVSAPAHKPSSSPQRQSGAPMLANGMYIGVVHSIAQDAKSVVLQYGPYEISAGLGSAPLDEFRVGGRVTFSVKQGTATANSPKAPPNPAVQGTLRDKAAQRP
jgi:hypothetical protein